MKKYILILIIFNFLIDCRENQPLTTNDCIVIQLEKSDFNLEFAKSDLNNSLDSARFAFRRQLPELINLIRKDVKFIMLDMWFPDQDTASYDELLYSAFLNSKNIVYAYGGIHSGNYEYNSEKFNFDNQKQGHIWIFEDNQSRKEIPNFYYDDNLSKSFQHITNLALIHNGYKIPPIPETILIDKNNFQIFKTYSFSEIRNNRNLYLDKYVVVFNNYDSLSDLHEINGSKIKGSQIICNSLVEFSKKFR